MYTLMRPRASSADQHRVQNPLGRQKQQGARDFCGPLFVSDVFKLSLAPRYFTEQPYDSLGDLTPYEYPRRLERQTESRHQQPQTLALFRAKLQSRSNPGHARGSVPKCAGHGSNAASLCRRETSPCRDRGANRPHFRRFQPLGACPTQRALPEA